MPGRFGQDCHGNWLENREDGTLLLHLPHHKEMFNWPTDQEMAIELGKASGTRGGRGGKPSGIPQHNTKCAKNIMAAGVHGDAQAADRGKYTTQGAPSQVLNGAYTNWAWLEAKRGNPGAAKWSECITNGC